NSKTTKFLTQSTSATPTVTNSRSRLTKFGGATLPRIREINSSDRQSLAPPTCAYATRPQQFLNFLPLPQGQGYLLPTFGIERRTGRSIATSPSPSSPTPAIAMAGCG